MSILRTLVNMEDICISDVYFVLFLPSIAGITYATAIRSILEYSNNKAIKCTYCGNGSTKIIRESDIRAGLLKVIYLI